MKKILIVMAVAFCIVGCGQKASRNNINYVEEGLKYLSQQDLPNAIKSFDLAIQKDPKNAETHISIAQIYFKLKNFPGVEALCLRVLQFDPNNGDAYYLLAMSRGSQGNPQEAFELLKRSFYLFSQQNNQEKAQMVAELLQKFVSEEAAP